MRVHHRGTRVGPVLAGIVALAALGACGAASSAGSVTVGAGASPSTPAPAASAPAVPWPTPSAGPSPLPSAPSGPASLRIVLDSGEGQQATWTLTCQPPGGEHPDPAAACGVLGANGASAFTPVPPNSACTMIYGGPQTARVTGTWKGKPVAARFSLDNGCEIARWNELVGVLPPSGHAS